MAKKDILKYWDRSVFDKYIRYDSTKEGKLNEQIPAQNTTYIHFKAEGVIAVIGQSDHCVEIYSTDEEIITSITIPAVEEGRKAYPHICCHVENGKVILKLPVCEWFDNYPHCDGEYDRWDTTTLGYHIVTFDPCDNSVTVELYE